MRYSIVALSLAALTTHAIAQEAYSAKSLFFSANDSVVAVGTGQKQGADANNAVAAVQSPESQVPMPVKVSQKKKRAPQIGASYFVRLKDDDGTTHDVLTRRIFRSGEKFQLGVKVNRPSYVYILNEAPDGSITQIYPQPSQDNFVDAMGIVFFPAKGSFQFDDKPGMEKLMVYLSPERAHGDITRRLRTAAPDLVSSPANLQTAEAGSCPAASTTVIAAATAASDATAPLQLASASPDYAAKGIAFAPDQTAGCAAQVAQADAAGYSAKGIVFSDDQTPAAGGQVASYVVKHTTRSDQNLYLKINLAHE
ncbi:hypothetical protein BCh11DRAFT_00807 [Burkholderia sp. Ch1-1]|uniref:DUF4384 domain-containing protein n=1 Tax=Paraburkholderia dioscoreae TaxID=2604047 RepID=A0A5Q4ZFZ1_9BURK|nr:MULTISPECIES: DUF4384 domain-containing protein [Paraburkholderia]EIF33047.1 hypothetical protein BCh11DRAFT_00807 [Burkholderia sp. Ch1-1]MDR8401996.1 DUF4384 domain-containing protein [Paraburkholderia sp. USG1]VVD31863.1 conserved exported protein of unknown function [Paraburkholderia dioscoreae]